MKLFEVAGTDLDSMIDYFRKFLRICMAELDLPNLPRIDWISGGRLHKERHSFGTFKNDDQVIRVEISNRHPIDIMRTLAHELVHYRQWLDGRMRPDSGKTGSTIENEAHAITGVIMRKFNGAYPDAFEMKPILENFADGKKPGRKGLAKRVGVNCKQSVTKLRKIAKTSSGERSRMAHWCANMKSGRKKK